MYRLTRDLHLYGGLFVSPFLVLFALSVFFLNHGRLTLQARPPEDTVAGLRLPPGLADAQGVDAIAAVRQVLDQCRVTGEIGFVRRIRAEQRLVVPVWTPRRETTVTIDLRDGSASIARRTMSLWETFAYLHKSPGPHNAVIRGNWFWTRAWKGVADGTVYLLLFISVTGVYLWFVLRAERRVGAALLLGGACSLVGTVYAILR